MKVQQQQHRSLECDQFIYTLTYIPLLWMQKKEPVGEDEDVPEGAQNLESLTAETLSVWLSSL